MMHASIATTTRLLRSLPGPAAPIAGIWLALLALGLLGCSAPAVAEPGPGPQGGPPTRTISVDGHARVDLAPDLVDVTLVLEAQKATPQAAARELRAKRPRLLASLRRLGLPADRIRTSSLSLRPEYARYPATGITGYVASITFLVTLGDPEKIVEVMEAAAAEGVPRIQTASRSSKIVEQKVKVRDLALKAARDKAAQIAATMGVAVGAVLHVTESSGGSWQGDQWWHRTTENAYRPAPSPGSDAAPGLPDAIPLHLTVSVVFAIR